MRNDDNGFFEPSKRSPVGNKENQAVESWMLLKKDDFFSSQKIIIISY